MSRSQAVTMSATRSTSLATTYLAAGHLPIRALSCWGPPSTLTQLLGSIPTCVSSRCRAAQFMRRSRCTAAAAATSELHKAGSSSPPARARTTAKPLKACGAAGGMHHHLMQHAVISVDGATTHRGARASGVGLQQPAGTKHPRLWVSVPQNMNHSSWLQHFRVKMQHKDIVSTHLQRPRGALCQTAAVAPGEA